MSEVTTIGIDSSTKQNGVAVFVNGKLMETFSEKFDGTFDIEKLGKMINWYDNFFEDYMPDIVIIEETVPMQNSKAVTSLNKVWGAIFTVAKFHTSSVYAMHNRTAKKAMGAVTKADAVQMMRDKYKILANATDDECDAVLMVEAYIKEYAN